MHIFSARNVVYFVVVATFLNSCQAGRLRVDSSDPNKTGSEIWQPTEGTRSEWMACNGMPREAFERTKIKYQQLQEALVKVKGLKEPDNRVGVEVADSEINSLEGCIGLTEEQIDMLIAEAKKSKDPNLTRRKKRKMMNLRNNPYSKWPMPIHFKFDGTHDERQKTIIRNAFQHWMDNTCVRFSELATNAPFSDNHILMTNENQRCYSYIGRVAFKPQQINLYGNCLSLFGIPVHEIGHSLGLLHEQRRSDRDSAIRVVWGNVNKNLLSHFDIGDTDDYGVPYNYGSVMHRFPKDGASGDTMLALDPLYQMNMGQRTGLSFEDIKIINLAYCQGTCRTPLSQPCLRGGYQNPNRCSICFCPDGFSGQYCDQVAPPKDATCGGVSNLGSQGQTTIKSPGYDDKHYYISHQECNWWIKAPENYQLQLTFDGEFGLFSGNDVCFHWVEIKFKRDLGLEGGRFCGNRRPTVTVTSQSNEMMIVFRSNYTVNDVRELRGFQAIVKSINPVVGNNPVSTTTSTSTKTIGVGCSG